MPFAGPALTDVGAGDALGDLMAKLSTFMDSHAPKPPSESALSTWVDGRGGSGEDRMAEALECATACQEAGWAVVKHVTHVQPEFK